MVRRLEVLYIPMMDTFVGDFLSAGFGALLGAGSAFLLGLFVERRKETRQDRARVTNFLLDVATRRAFYADPRSVETSVEDARRLESAVQSLRRSSREVRLALHRPPRAATDALVDITRSCNQYLEVVENSQRGATDLAPMHSFLRRLASSSKQLHDALGEESVKFELPGQLAYPS